jgi:hypothetical protein
MPLHPILTVLALVALSVTGCVGGPPRVHLPAAPLTVRDLPAAIQANTGAPVVPGNSVGVLLPGAGYRWAACRFRRKSARFFQICPRWSPECSLIRRA